MDDLISRADVLNTIATHFENYGGFRKYATLLIKRIPSAQPKRGEWMPFEYGDDTWHKCSVCGVADKYRGSMPRPNGTIAEWEYVRNFCPNCGARMKGVDDE